MFSKFVERIEDGLRHVVPVSTTIGVRGGGGEGCRPPGWKNFRANSVFQGKRKLLKNPECKKYIQYSEKFLFFRASASCSKPRTVKKFSIQCFQCIFTWGWSVCLSSGLRRMKTYLRNTMGQDRLNSVALINIERCHINKVIENDIDSVIDIFAKRKHRHRYLF